MEVVKFRHRDIVQRFPSPCPLVMPCHLRLGGRIAAGTGAGVGRQRARPRRWAQTP